MCGHRAVARQLPANHVEDVYGDDYFFGGGDGYSDYMEEADLLRERGADYHRILRPHVGERVHLLDVGAAAGFVLQGLLDGGTWTGEGVEPNAQMARYAQEKNGLNVVTTPLEDFHSKAAFDVVSCIQVLPHFYDLTQAMDALRRITRLNSFWLVETWNRESKTARWFGQKWHEYSPPSVLHWFSPATLNALAQRYGFELVEQGRPKKKLLASHAKSLISHKLKGTGLAAPFESASRLIPNAWNLPYPGEDLMWALYRRVN